MTTATPVSVALALPLPAGCPPTPVRHPVRPLATFRAAAAHPTRPLLLALGAVTAVSSSATLASPYLIGEAPMLLACLSPRVAFLAIAAHETPLLPFIVLGALRLGLTDPLHYSLGRRLGSARRRQLDALRRWPALHRRLAGAAGRLPRPVRAATKPACCLAILLRPNGLNLLWAGSQRLPVPLVIALDVAGTVGYLAVVHAGTAALSG